MKRDDHSSELRGSSSSFLSFFCGAADIPTDLRTGRERGDRVNRDESVSQELGNVLYRTSNPDIGFGKEEEEDDEELEEAAAAVELVAVGAGSELLHLFNHGSNVCLLTRGL